MSPAVVPVHSPVIGVTGNSVVLRFSVINSNPPVTIDNVRWLWSRQGIVSDITNSAMIDNSALTFESNYTTQMYSLTISSIQLNYTSRFVLIARNPAGMDSVFINLIVEGIQCYHYTSSISHVATYMLGTPHIIEGPTDTIEVDDNDVTLLCSAVAFPQHNITWMFQRTTTDNVEMIISTSSPDPHMKYLINDRVNTAGYGMLTITNLQYSDRGIYTCMASNDYGAVSATAIVNVHGKNFVNAFTNLLYIYTCMLFTVKPSNQTISGGGRFNISSEVNLTCTVIRVPLPAVVWKFNGINIDIPSDCILNSYNASLQMRSVPTDCLLQQSLNLVDTDIAERVTDPQDIVSLGAYDLSELIVESTLTISSLQRSDNGSYTCNITNMLPETSTISVVTDFTTVVVLGKIRMYAHAMH